MNTWKLKTPETSSGLAAELITSHSCAFIILLLLCPVLASAREGLIPPYSGPTNAPPLQTWSFNDTTNWTTDQGNAPVAFANLSWSNLGDYAALVVDNTNAAFLNYPVWNANGTTNLTVDNGSIVAWVAPNWTSSSSGGTGPGVYGRIFEVGAYTDDASFGWWSLYFDSGGDNLIFSAQDNNGCTVTYLTAPIYFDVTNRWHNIVLTYSTTNGCALYLDGALLTNGPSMSCWPGSNVLAGGFSIGSDGTTTGLAQSHTMLDDIATYSYPLNSTNAGAAFAKATPSIT